MFKFFKGAYFERVSLAIVRWGLLLVPFTPLIVIRIVQSPFNFGKMIAFRLLIDIILIFYVYLIIRRPEYRPVIPKFNYRTLGWWGVVLFFGSYLFATLFGVSWWHSFWGSWERMGGLLSLLHYMAFFVMAISIFKTREDWLNLLGLSVIAAAASSFYGLMQKLPVSEVVGAGNRFRIFGTQGNAAAFASYLIPNAFFAAYLMHEQRRWLLRVFYFIALLLFTVCIIMTAVRGAVIALGAGIVIYAFCVLLMFIRRRAVSRSSVIGGLIGLILVVVLSVAIAKTPLGGTGYFSRLNDLSLKGATIQSRIGNMKIAWQGIKQRPFLGWGPENYVSVFSKAYDPKFPNPAFMILYDKAHNFIFDTAATQGLLGLAGLLLLYIWLVREIWRRSADNQRAVLTAFVIAWLINFSLFFDLFSTYITTLLLFGLAYSTNITDQKVAAADISLSIRSKYLLPSTIILSGLSLVFGVIFPFVSNAYAVHGMGLLQQFQYREALARGFNDFSIAQRLAFGYAEDVYRLQYDNLALVFGGATDANLVPGLMDMTKRVQSGLEKIAKRNPYDFSNHTYLFLSYKLTGTQNGDAYRVIDQAGREFNKTIPVLYTLYNYQLSMGMNSEAIQTAQRAVEISDTPRTHLWLALAKTIETLDSGDEDNYRRNFAEVLVLAPQAYVAPDEDILNFSKVIQGNKRYVDMARLHVNLAGVDPQYYVTASFGYALAKDRANALKYADKALALEPRSLNPAQWELLQKIYQWLGDNKKRSEAFLKSSKS